MKDLKYLELLEAVWKEIKKRYGDKPCETLIPNCGNCDSMILCGYLINEIDTVRWSLNNEIRFSRKSK